MAADGPFIHLVRHGKTWCGVLSCELDAKDRWVEALSLEQGAATCPGCKQKLEVYKLQQRGIDPRVIKKMMKGEG
jgi:hypothetical protein